MSALPPYQYQPLPGVGTAFRLLKVLHNNEPDISCSLHVEDLDHAPPYDALSHTWEVPRPVVDQTTSPAPISQTFELCCNGQHLKVQENLYRALRQLCDCREADCGMSLQ